MAARKNDYDFAILGAAVLLFILLLLCALKIICPTGECGPGLIKSINCPGGCSLPDGSCPCPDGSFSCQDRFPGINCPSGCCTGAGSCVATPACPENTLWSAQNNCCLLVVGDQIGQCVSICTDDSSRIGGCIAGVDSCDSGNCCPAGSAGWFFNETDPAESCCKDKFGNCMYVCGSDYTKVGCNAPGTDACRPDENICSNSQTCGTCVDGLCGGITGSIKCETYSECVEIACETTGSCGGSGVSSCCPLGTVTWGQDPADETEFPAYCCLDKSNECVRICLSDPERTACDFPGTGGCGIGGCCPIGTTWDTEQTCCSNKDGVCAIVCSDLDCTKCINDEAGALRCGGKGDTCTTDTSCTGAICSIFGGCQIRKCTNDADCKTCDLEINQCGSVGFFCDENSDCSTTICSGEGCCPVGSNWNREKQCCVSNDNPTQCIYGCPDGTNYDTTQSCCVYEGTSTCYQNCQDGSSYDVSTGCCTYDGTDICTGGCGEGTTYNPATGCCTYIGTDICAGGCDANTIYDSTDECCGVFQSECVICQAGTLYDSLLGCCAWYDTKLCAETACFPPSVFDSTLGCCVLTENPNICIDDDTSVCSAGTQTCDSACCTSDQTCENVLDASGLFTIKACVTNQIVCQSGEVYSNQLGCCVWEDTTICVGGKGETENCNYGTPTSGCLEEIICGSPATPGGGSCADIVDGFGRKCTDLRIPADGSDCQPKPIGACISPDISCGSVCCPSESECNLETSTCTPPDPSVCSEPDTACGSVCCQENSVCIDQEQGICSTGCTAPDTACGSKCCSVGSTCDIVTETCSETPIQSCVPPDILYGNEEIGIVCCPSGTELNIATGSCQATSCSPTSSKCGDVCCPGGLTCNNLTNTCELKTKCTAPDTVCGNECCPSGKLCDPNTNTCVQEIVCTSGLKIIGDVCSTSSECACGLNCQIIPGIPGGPGVCCTGGLFTCFSGTEVTN